VRVYGGEDFSVLLRGRWRAALAVLLLRHHVFEVVLDVVLVTVAYYAAYSVRFDQSEFEFFFPTLLGSLPIVIACKIVSLRLAGAYGGIWRYFGTSEVIPLVRGIALGSGMAVLSFAYLYRFERVSRSVLLIDGVLFAGLLIGSRLAVRLMTAAGDRTRLATRGALAYGAGDAGEVLARELANNPRYAFHLVAFLDDDPYKEGRRVRGVQVVGGIGALEGLLAGGAEAVILTSTKLPNDLVQTVRTACEEAGVPLLRFECVLNEVPGAGRTKFRASVPSANLSTVDPPALAD